MEQALSDVTVLDLGQVIAMPFCTMLLADMGARVIKVESLEQARERLSLGMKRVRDGVEERVPVYQYRDRNKQAITLNLKTSQGVELFNRFMTLERGSGGDVPLPFAPSNFLSAKSYPTFPYLHKVSIDMS